MYRRPLALHGFLCAVLATALAPVSAEVEEISKNNTGISSPEPEEASTTENSGHILFKAARRKHKKHAKSQENAVHAYNAVEAAETAGQAATIAHRVANHAESIEANAADALAYAKDALHGAAVNAGGASKGALEDAVARVNEATDGAGRAATATRYSTATGGDVTDTEYGKLERRLGRLQNELDNGKGGTGDGNQVESEIHKLQQKLDAMKKAPQAQPGAAEKLQQQLHDLEQQMEAAKVARAAGLEPPPGTASEDEIKVKLEETREQLGKLSGSQGQPAVFDPQQRLRELQDQLDKLRQLRAKEAQAKTTPDNAALKTDIAQLRKDLGAAEGATSGEVEGRLAAEIAKLEREMDAAPGSPIDIDTTLPYGEAEPFGREQTASEMTASAKYESDTMVDQIERAETMEERRAVFRALTRLRGATISAYDGIAKSHLNNVVQYNKEHKWRDTHPVKHLAQEEDDVSRWAFPNNSEEVPPAAAGPATGPAAAPAPAPPSM